LGKNETLLFDYGKIKKNDQIIIGKIKKGKYYGNVYLVKNKNYLIRKIYNSKIIYKNSKRYYLKYFNNKTKIKLPFHTFSDTSLTQSIGLASGKTFSYFIRMGKYRLSDAINEFKKIKTEIENLYGDLVNPKLISGDFTTNNIYENENGYLLIDYGESFIESPYYDLYTLLRSLLSDFCMIKYNSSKSVRDVILQPCSLLGCEVDMFSHIEKIFAKKMKQRTIFSQK
jgi:hypothetical protein